QNKVVLVVNVASKCGFTTQYDGLEALHKKYKDQGLLILGVPTNDFKQEPSDGESCRLNFGVTFPILEKQHVNGPETSALYKHLRQAKPWPLVGDRVTWNFEKFLINKSGKVVGRYA
ncbi:thioredoxin-like protein, partial [Chytriomyces sp. MP71]